MTDKEKAVCINHKCPWRDTCKWPIPRGEGEHKMVRFDDKEDNCYDPEDGQTL